MVDMDIRYILILFPLLYVVLPFIFSGAFILLLGVTAFTFLGGIILFIVITNLNIGGGGGNDILLEGNFHFNLNDEGSYSLFVVCIGGIFYFGAQALTILSSFLNIILFLPNAIIGLVNFLSFGLVKIAAFSANNILGLGSLGLSNLSQWYPLNIQIAGVSLFGAIDAIAGVCFILGLYFMISSRGH
jgi:hypothetical protein